jgi:hypothetical protein
MAVGFLLFLQEQKKRHHHHVKMQNSSIVGVKTNPFLACVKAQFSGNLTCFHPKSTGFHTKVWCEQRLNYIHISNTLATH